MCREEVIVLVLLTYTFTSDAMRLPLLPFPVPLSDSNMEKLRTTMGEDENPEEFSGQFEGDIVLNADQINDLHLRNALDEEKYSWPNNTVVYELSAGELDPAMGFYIREALDEIEAVTCLKFIPRKDEENYIQVTSEDTGCHSAVGYQGEVQQLNLQGNAIGKGCFRKGTIIHEFIHALGFFHQQSAPERDDYVDVVWDNIQEGKERNFEKREASNSLGFPYDYESVMHYSDKAFSKNGERTIVPKDPEAHLGQRVRMSDTDVRKLNKKYCSRVSVQ